MLSKEEIEKVKYRLKFHSNYAGIKNDCCIVSQSDIRELLEYTEQLEQSSQKLIEKLEQDIKNNYTIKNYTGNSYCIVGCEEIEVKKYSQEILSLLKGEKE